MTPSMRPHESLRDGVRSTQESYGAQPPVELLRQFLDFKGFYDRDKLFWKDITDTMLFTGAAPPGGGRSVVTPRFTRHYNVFCVPPASEAVMKVIFESIFSGFMKPFDKDVQRLVGAYLGVLLRSCDSWPSHDAGGRFFSEFGPLRGPRRRDSETRWIGESR